MTCFGLASLDNGTILRLLQRLIFQGTLFMVFFISLCSSILAPFRCHIHPNGLWTVQSYDEARDWVQFELNSDVTDVTVKYCEDYDSWWQLMTADDSYAEVFCDGTQEHLQMALVGGFACRSDQWRLYIDGPTSRIPLCEYMWILLRLDGSNFKSANTLISVSSVFDPFRRQRKNWIE